jgi:hypothetical protein
MQASAAGLLLCIAVPGAVAATSSHKAVRVAAVAVQIVTALLAVAGFFG